MNMKKMYMEWVRQFILENEMSSQMCRNTYQLQSSSQTHQLWPEQLLTSSVLDWSGANRVCSVPSDKFNQETSLRNGLDLKKKRKKKCSHLIDVVVGPPAPHGYWKSICKRSRTSCLTLLSPDSALALSLCPPLVTCHPTLRGKKNKVVHLIWQDINLKK